MTLPASALKSRSRAFFLVVCFYPDMTKNNIKVNKAVSEIYNTPHSRKKFHKNYFEMRPNLTN